MNKNILRILKKELREILRDKKSLSMMLVIPIFIPLMIIGMSGFFDSQTTAIEDYNKIGVNYQLSDSESVVAGNLGIETFYDTNGSLEKKTDNGTLDLFITKSGNIYTIHSLESNQSAIALASSFLGMVKEQKQQAYLGDSGVNYEDFTSLVTVEHEYIEADNFFVTYMINYAFLFIIMAITVSVTYPATDTTAGEKARGTLETLLSLPIKRKEIILGKYFAVSLSAIATGLLCLALAIAALSVLPNMFDIYSGVETMYTLEAMLVAILIIVVFSLFISSLCLLIASKSGSFKAAQSALTPLIFICLFPSMIVFMGNLKLSLVFSLVPFLNFTNTFTNVTNGNTSFLDIGIMAVSTIVYTFILSKILIKSYESEAILFDSK